jgi:hypothetical protein
MAPLFWRELAAENPLGSNRITPRDAEDWFDLKWPLMREYCGANSTSKGIRRRIVNWWSRVDAGEIDRARARGVEIRRSQAVAKLTQIATKVLPPDSQQIRKDLPPLTVSRRGGDG